MGQPFDPKQFDYQETQHRTREALNRQFNFDDDPAWRKEESEGIKEPGKQTRKKKLSDERYADLIEKAVKRTANFYWINKTKGDFEGEIKLEKQHVLDVRGKYHERIGGVLITSINLYIKGEPTGTLIDKDLVKNACSDKFLWWRRNWGKNEENCAVAKAKDLVVSIETAQQNTKTWVNTAAACMYLGLPGKPIHRNTLINNRERWGIEFYESKGGNATEYNLHHIHKLIKAKLRL